MLARIATLALLVATPAFGQSTSLTNPYAHPAGGGGGGTDWVTFVRVQTTGSGNQSFSGDLDGATATAAIVWTNRDSVATAPAEDGGGFSIGVTDCTDQYNYHGNSRDAVGTPDNNHRAVSDTLVFVLTNVSVLSPTDPSDYQGKATLVSCDTDGITLNWTDAPSTNLWVNALIFAGTDGADVGLFTPNTTQDASTDVTTLGDSAHFALVVGGGAPSWDNAGNDFPLSLGFYAVDGGDPQQAVNVFYFDAGADAIASGGADTTRIAYDVTSAASSYTLEASVISTGIRFTTRDAAGVGDEYMYFILDLDTDGGQSAYVDWFTLSESTGAQELSDAPWTPEAGLFITASDTNYVGWVTTQDSTMEAFTLSAYDQNSGGLIGTGIDDNTGDPDQMSSWQWTRSASLLYGYWPSRPDSLRAAFTSWDSDGFTINVNVAPNKGRNIIYAIFEDQ